MDPESVRVPAPVLVMPPDPLIAEPMVSRVPLALVTVTLVPSDRALEMTWLPTSVVIEGATLPCTREITPVPESV